VLHVGKAMLASRVGQMFRSDIDNALRHWREIENFLDHKDKDMRTKLALVHVAAA